MAGNLYELLEVNETASHEAIVASYQRLRAALNERLAESNDDVSNRLIAIREAHAILSNPDQRRRYDEKLAIKTSTDLDAVSPPRLIPRWLIVAALIVFSGVWYAKYQSDKEKMRLEREQAREAAAAMALEAEAKKAREERLALEAANRQRLQQESLERYERERAIAYGNQVSRDVKSAESQLQLRANLEKQRQDVAERERLNDAERQLAKEKAYLRQLEFERNRYR